MTALDTKVTFDALRTRLTAARRRLDRRAGEAQAIARRGTQLQREIVDLSSEVDTLARASAVLTSIGEERQAEVQKQIETLVTKGLQTIFSDDLSFHLVSTVRHNRPEVDFIVRSTIGSTRVDTPVLDARGGGLSATVGFLLRAVILLLDAQRNGQVLFLDETFSHVSAEYEGRLAEFIRELVDKTNMQIIMVTHSEAFSDVADVKHRFRLVNGATVVDAG